MSNVNVDLNATKCLVHQESIGQRIITNICNGDVTKIDWTVFDWLNAGAFSIFVLFLIAVSLGVLGFFAYLIYDAWR